jgi:hypothetical protein
MQLFICDPCYQEPVAALPASHKAMQSTALHMRTDLAVSFLPSDRTIPEGTLAFQHWRFCSHRVCYQRWALPTTFDLPFGSYVLGLSSRYYYLAIASCGLITVHYLLGIDKISFIIKNRLSGIFLF